VAAARGHPVAVSALRPSPRRSAVDVVSWLALAAGAIMILGAWAISFRVQPPRRVRGHG
jgi:hypothetical protein